MKGRQVAGQVTNGQTHTEDCTMQSQTHSRQAHAAAKQKSRFGEHAQDQTGQTVGLTALEE